MTSQTLSRYHPKNIDTQHYFGQFILTAESLQPPENWQAHEHGPWCLFTLMLPVLDVYDQENRWLGWCIGYPVINGECKTEPIHLSTSQVDIDMAAIDDFYERASGKWMLLLLSHGYETIFLDPYGSLAAVYSTVEKTIASTPSLIGTNHDWDDVLIREIGLPENDVWLPSGLTAKKNVRRLLPNHCLRLSGWSVHRHWPTPETDLSADANTKAALAKIVARVKSTIDAIAKKYPLCFTLTAGRDSRSVLACARDYTKDSVLFTFAVATASPDMQIPAFIANRLRLNHKFISPAEASSEELESWLMLTGWSVSGKIWKIHKTLKSLDTKRALLPGTSAEVHKGVYHRPNDKAETKLTASKVLTRCNLPHHPVFINATESWLQELRFLDTFKILDLVHLEQRLGCWAAPQCYGNTTSRFEISVYNSRPIYYAMMRLPHDYRLKKQLATDICRQAWPELLEFPFNEYPGMKGKIRSGAKRAKQFVKVLLGR